MDAHGARQRHTTRRGGAHAGDMTSGPVSGLGPMMATGALRPRRACPVPEGQEGDLPARAGQARWEAVLRLRARYAGTGLVVSQG